LYIFSNAQGIRGMITNTEGQPVPYTNIYVPVLKSGTTSNHEGQFELKLPDGEWEVLFQYIGYKTYIQKFNVTNSSEDVKIIMQTQSVNIKEIKVLASGEDPAYYVMRHAIAMAPYYTNQVSEYDCKLYLKGTGIIYKIPRLFKKRLEKEGVEKDKPFVLESLNKIHFELPDNLKQEVIAMHSTGDDNDSDAMEMITTNLYNVSEYGVTSPVGRNAMKVYKFELAGVFEDQGKLINKIKVIPKNKGKGAFEGIINIVEDYWNIHSADLDFTMPMMDVTMRQLYGLVENNTWMPTSFDFEMDMAALGFGIKYNYVASFSEYSVVLNKNLDHSFQNILREKEIENTNILDSLAQAELIVKPEVKSISKNQKKIETLRKKKNLSNRDMYKLERLMDKEIKRTLPPEPIEIINPVKIGKNAINNDSVYWASFRPIPLTHIETSTFSEKDSISEVHNSPEYKDSIQNGMRKFKITDLILGRTYRYEKDSARFNSRFSISGIINLSGLTFNTVDGFYYTLPFSYNLTDTLGRRFTASTNIGYAFSRKTPSADYSVYYLYNGKKRSWVNFRGGIKAVDFKRNSALSSFENDFYTLFFEDNFQKFYENKFVNVLWGTEISNGLNIRAGFQIAKRSPLKNHSDYKFINAKNKDYTPNIPQIDHLVIGQLSESKATTAQLRLTYTPKQRYRIRNNIKYPTTGYKPTFVFYYEKGFKNIFGSDVNYDFVSASINQNLKIGFDNYLDYSVTAGGFINDKKLFAPDFKYFNVNNQAVLFTQSANRFYLLDYYKSIQSGYFLEAHTAINFKKLIFMRLPLLNRTLMRESLFGSYLTTDFKNHYFEIGYGLNNIFLIMDAAVVAGFENGKHQSTGMKLSFNLN